MVRVCLDIDILLDYLIGNESAEEKINIYLDRRDTELCVAATTLAELRVSLRNPHLVDELEDMLVVLPIDENVAALAGDIYDYMEENEKVRMSRVYVAAACVAHGALLLTKNRAYYSNIPGLKVI